MLFQESFVEVGRIRKGHGYQGHARIDIDDDYLEDFKKQEFLFLEVDGYKVPFKIVHQQEYQHLIVKLSYIDSPEDLLPFHQQSIYLLDKNITSPKASDTVPSKSHYVGYQIIDAQLGNIGAVIRIESYPQQLMAFVTSQDNELMIPLHESLISKIVEKEKVIYMNLPDGLLEL